MTRSKILLLLGLLATVFSAGCGTRVVYVKRGDPVRLRQPIRNVKVWAYGQDGKLAPGVIREIPEGWWCVDDHEPGRRSADDQ